LWVSQKGKTYRVAQPHPAIDALGAHVIVRGQLSQDVWHGDVQVLSATTEHFADAKSDWSWFQNDDARRFRYLCLRSELIAATRAFFAEKHFLEVETPACVPSPGLDIHLSAIRVEAQPARQFLITSPEYQMKRLLSAGLERIYQICRAFRNDEEGNLHQPEFTMLEWYRAFSGMDAMIQDTEALVAALCKRLFGQTQIAESKVRPAIDMTPPWERISVAQAFTTFAGIELTPELVADDTRFYRILTDHIEPHLGKHKPTVLVDYPLSMASLARPHPTQPDVAERFEVYVDGIELCNGFGELTDPVEQAQRFATDQRLRSEKELPVYPIDQRFLASLRAGIAPSGGNALGLDRLVMLLVGADDIRDVVAFSSDRL